VSWRKAKTRRQPEITRELTAVYGVVIGFESTKRGERGVEVLGWTFAIILHGMR
jgi:hypothetical protein